MSPEKKNRKTFHLISLGCAKNSVDSDSIAKLLEGTGYRAVEQPRWADVIIVNTCGFIAPAREESYAVLKDLAGEKRKDQFLVAAGCLPQRSREELLARVNGIDGILSTRRWMDILDLVDSLRSNSPSPRYDLPIQSTVGTDEHGISRVSVQGGSAYLKIADGCRRPCAFCSIPLIKGAAVSRPMEQIIKEARELQEAGIQEVILIAQDTTDYGSDLGMKDGLAELLQRVCDSAPQIPWIRIMYAYPGYVTDRLIDTIASHNQILPYLDIPLQHADPGVLTRMRRPANMEWVRSTISKMRTSLPGMAIRSTFIVGYPGETEREFENLLEFIREIRFDHIGVFPFSFESGTASEPLGDSVSPGKKEERIGRLMELQEKISLANNQQFVGREMAVLVEGSDNEISISRSYRDAPEIDGLVILNGVADIGRIVKARINGAMIHDLTGEIIK
jgi:ribosomal protein S12 methylthiotransferase